MTKTQECSTSNMDPIRCKKILPNQNFTHPSDQATSSNTGNKDEAAQQKDNGDAFIEQQEDHVEIYYNEQDSYSESSPTSKKEDGQEHGTLSKEVGSCGIHPVGIDNTMPSSTQGLPQIPPLAYPVFSTPPLVNFPNYQTHNIHLINQSSKSHQLVQGVSVLASQPIVSFNNPGENLHPQTSIISTDKRDDNVISTPTSSESSHVAKITTSPEVSKSSDNTIPTHSLPKPIENVMVAVQPDTNLSTSEVEKSQECSTSSNLETTKWKKILPKPGLKEPSEQATSSNTEKKPRGRPRGSRNKRNQSETSVDFYTDDPITPSRKRKLSRKALESIDQRDDDGDTENATLTAEKRTKKSSGSLTSRSKGVTKQSPKKKKVPTATLR